MTYIYPCPRTSLTPRVFFSAFAPQQYVLFSLSLLTFVRMGTRVVEVAVAITTRVGTRGKVERLLDYWELLRGVFLSLRARKLAEKKNEIVSSWEMEMVAHAKLFFFSRAGRGGGRLCIFFSLLRTTTVHQCGAAFSLLFLLSLCST